MSTRAAALRLDRVADLLDRARQAVTVDAAELQALLDLAAQTIAESDATGARAGVRDAQLDRAIERVRANHDALVAALRAELGRVGQQLAAVTVGRDASASYGSRTRSIATAAPAGRLDRVG